MKTPTILIFSAGCLLAQTAQYPDSIASIQQLGQVANGVTGTLNNSLTTSSTSLNITNGTCTLAGQSTACSSAFQPNMFITVQNEIMQVCSMSAGSGVEVLNFGVVGSSCPSLTGRGLDGTQIAAHTTPAFPNKITVNNNITAWTHMANSAEIIAIEKSAGPQYSILLFGGVGDGTPTTGTDNIVAANLAETTLNGFGGGVVYVPALSSGNCFNMEGVVLLSNVSWKIDGCVRYPKSSPMTQMFRPPIPVGSGVSNVHFFGSGTVDGNKANLTLTSDQNGINLFEFTVCNNCSVMGLNIINAGTDNFELAGSDTTAQSATVNVTNTTTSVSGAVCANGGYTTWTAIGHGLPIGAQTAVTITGVMPSGYNITNQNLVALDANHLSGFISCPSAYVSGGSAVYSTITNVSGDTFAGFGNGIPATITGGIGNITVDSGYSNTVVYPTVVLSTASGASMSWVWRQYVSENVNISGNVISGANRNNISLEGGTNVHINGNDISDATGILSGPWAGIDQEPDSVGENYYGLVIENNKIHGNQGLGISLKAWPDPNANPVLKNNMIYSNTGGGVKNGSSLWPSNQTTLTIDGDRIWGNGSGSAVSLSGYPNVIIQNAFITDTGTALGLNALIANASIGTSVLSGGNFDFGCAPDGFTNATFVGTILVHNTIQASGCPVLSVPTTRIDAPHGINAQAIPYFNTSLPNSLTTSHYGYIQDFGGTNPDLYFTNYDYSLSLGNWNSGTSYVTGNMVSYNFTYYKATANSLNQNPASDTSHTYWLQECRAYVYSFTNDGVFANFQGVGCPSVFGGIPDTLSAKTIGIVPVEGMKFNIIDGSTATWGATVTGGGSNHVEVRYNGTNYTVVGK